MKKLDVPPRPSMDRVRRDAVRLSEESRQLGDTEISRGMEASHFQDDFGGQAGAGGSLFDRHIPHVVVMRSKPQMGGIDASPVGAVAGRIVNIATVQDMKPVRDGAVVQFPRKTVGAGVFRLGSSIDSKMPTAFAVDGSGPKPTSFCFADLFPESLFRRASRMRGQTGAAMTAKLAFPFSEFGRDNKEGLPAGGADDRDSLSANTHRETSLPGAGPRRRFQRHGAIDFLRIIIVLGQNPTTPLEVIQ